MYLIKNILLGLATISDFAWANLHYYGENDIIPSPAISSHLETIHWRSSIRRSPSCPPFIYLFICLFICDHYILMASYVVAQIVQDLARSVTYSCIVCPCNVPLLIVMMMMMMMLASPYFLE